MLLCGVSGRHMERDMLGEETSMCGGDGMRDSVIDVSGKDSGAARGKTGGEVGKGGEREEERKYGRQRNRTGGRGGRQEHTGWL